MELSGTRKIPLGWRTAVGLAFWVVGAAGFSGACVAGYHTAQAKVAAFAAEGDNSRAEIADANRTLGREQTAVWVDLATGLASVAVGASLTRKAGDLWTGELVGSPTSAGPPPGEAVVVELVPPVAVAEQAA